MKNTWIRRDRGDGTISSCSEADVAQRLKGIYTDVALAMRAATPDCPVSSGMADYWPSEVIRGPGPGGPDGQGQ